MSSIHQIIDALRHSPQLPQALEILRTGYEAERDRREQFYREMTPEQKVEFIDGQVILHSPAKNRHLVVTGHVFQILNVYVTKAKLGEVRIEKCLCTFPRNDYEPDVVFFRTEKAAQWTADTLKFPIPDMVVEVLSDSTEQRDRGVKFEDYAANGVVEYWIVDADSEFIEQYVLATNRFELRLRSNSGFIQSVAVGGFRIPIEAIFNSSTNLKTLSDILHA